jgi:hypothetical protein
MQTAPAEESAEVTALGTVWPVTKLRFDASGRVPQGYTVTYPPDDDARVVVTVTLSETPVAPVGTTCMLPSKVGIVPVTCSVRAAAVPSSAPNRAVERVSRIRTGDTGTKTDPDDEVA